jgi:hypothetical protein
MSNENYKLDPQKYLVEEEKNLRITSLKCQVEEEMIIKNNLYSFLIDKGVSCELDTYRRSHDLSSCDCHDIESQEPDPLAEAQKEYEIEKNVKNNLYKFILEHGLFHQLLEYNDRNGIQIPDGRIHALSGVARNVYIKEKKHKKLH